MSTLRWEDGHGREVSKEVKLTVPDVREFKGLAGYPFLLIAANPHLSGSELERLLESEGLPFSRSWIYRRMWMFRESSYAPPPLSIEDQRAIAIMKDAVLRANKKLSARKLVYVLKGRGIKRSKNWVWRHRG